MPADEGPARAEEPLPEKRQWPMDEDIVISGISGRYPESNSVDEFWEKLLSGVELISSNDLRWPVGKSSSHRLVSSASMVNVQMLQIATCRESQEVQCQSVCSTFCRRQSCKTNFSCDNHVARVSPLRTA